MIADLLSHRSAGLLCHVTSLPSVYGIGDVGTAASSFVEFAARAGAGVWQILPLTPTDSATGNSPYSSRSAFAANALLIDPADLAERGLVTEEDLVEARVQGQGPVDYQGVIAAKRALLDRAFDRFVASKPAREQEAFEAFCERQADWLDDYASFVVLKARYEGRAWWDWPEELARRAPAALEEARAYFSRALEREKFVQFLFFSQYRKLKDLATRSGVTILGDLPIYVSRDSVDVWAHRDVFKLDDKGRPTVVAGVPPDYFSKTGQLWGNPVYDWQGHKEDVYDWWTRRMAHALDLYDLVRIDHFRGFASYWEVPAHHRTAMHGQWVQGPGPELFEHFRSELGSLPLVAEDLGTITQDVRDLMGRFEIPGCRVLLFAFGDDMPDNPHRPDNHGENSLVYTGTHDNNTAKGWFEQEADQRARQRLAAALGHETDAERVSWDLVQLALSSRARLALLPIQDLLGLGAEARMNTPATAKGNWRWRLGPNDLTDELARRFRQAVQAADRLG